MTDLLFVYGSLISRIAHPQGERLRREADLVGPATLQGRLYRVSWYPAAVISADLNDCVRGEVYRLRTPGQTLAWLDEYEGISRGTTSVAPADEYARKTVSVTDAHGTRLMVLIYLYQRSTDGLVRVSDGHWQG